MLRSARLSAGRSLALGAAAAFIATACLPVAGATAVEPKASLTIKSGTMKQKTRAVTVNMTATCHGGGKAAVSYAYAKVQGRSYQYEREIVDWLPAANSTELIPKFGDVTVACDGKPHDLKVKLKGKSGAWPAAGTGTVWAGLSKSDKKIAETSAKVPFSFG
ncbi:hypothetical protein ACFVYR_30585 [Streptomyces sp. NPDC058284]|uniref:hypothetical protein n=1 Tax=unclassified Streptomyces TaxID=2593676 RepID=UPI003660A80F